MLDSLWQYFQRNSTFWQWFRSLLSYKRPLLTTVLSSGGYNRIPWTAWLINNREVFLTVLETGKAKIKALAHSVSGKRLLCGFSMAVFSPCPHMAGGARELSGAPVTKAQIPFMRASPSWSHHLPRAPPPNTVTLGVRVPQRNFGVIHTFGL